MSIDSKQNSEIEFLQQASLFDASTPAKSPTVQVEDEFDYLNFPGTRTLLAKVQEVLVQGKAVKFKLGNLLTNNQIAEAGFLCDSKQDYKLQQGCKASPSGLLLSQAIAGQKFLGDFSIAYIEAMAAKYLHQALYKDVAVDHFHFTEGLCNIGLFSDCIKAHRIKKNNLAIAVMPETAFKAARRNRFSGWDVIKFQQRPASFNKGKIYQVNKNNELVSEVNLVEDYTDTLVSPIYKVKIDERWVIVLAAATNYLSISQGGSITIDQKLIDSIAHKQDYQPQNRETIEFTASPGQAVRVIFNLLGDYDAVPEALLNLEGGSWSGLATESSASGRHDGSNSMHEVLRNGWHLHPDIAIPWNYLSFEKIDSVNQANDADFLVATEPGQDLYLESDQSWKRANRGDVINTLKYVYEQYRTVASKQLLLSAKEQMQILARYIAYRHCEDSGVPKLSIHGDDREPPSRRSNPDLKPQVNSELSKYLDMICKTHDSAAANKTFFSSKVQ